MLKRIGWIVGIVALTAAIVTAAAAAQSGNLVENGGFEGGFYTFDAGKEVPNGWDAWWLSEGDPDPCRTTAPNFNAQTEAGSVHSGSVAASYWGVDLGYTAGLRQRIAVTPGTTYRLTAYGYSWSAEDREKPDSDDFTQMRIGLDPTGGVNFGSPSIVWSPDQFPMDQYAPFSVEATAQSELMTIYLAARPNWCNPRNDTYWDTVELVAIGEAPEDDGGEDQPEPTQAPPTSDTSVPVGSIPVATPGPNGDVVHRVNPGETLTGIAFSYGEVYNGVSPESITELNGLTSDIITVGQELLIVSDASSGGGESAEPTEAPSDEEESDDGASGDGASGDGTSDDEPSGESDGSEDPAEVAEATSEPVEEEDSIAGTGTICVQIYEDANGNAIRDPGETPISETTFAVNDGTATVADGVTDSASTLCFGDLTPGSYTVSWADERYTPTTEQALLTDVEAGGTVQHEFGAQQIEGGAETVPGTPAAEGEGLPPVAIALLAGGGAIFVLLGIGVALYFFVIQPRLKTAA